MAGAHRLTREQRETLYGHWRARESTAPRVVERAMRGGLLRPYLPLAEDLLFGRRSDAIRLAPYVFSGDKFRQLIAGFPASEIALIGTRRSQLRFAAELGVPAHSVFRERRALSANFPAQRQPELLDRAYDRLVRALEGEPGRFLVVKTDTNPIQRLLIYAARAAGMRSAVIQHGVFQRASPGFVMDGWAADYTLTYDSYQQDLLAEKGIARDKMRTLGFHTRPVAERYAPPAVGRKRRICFMGQSWANLSAALEERYVAVLRECFAVLRDAGLAPVMKPHPRELGRSYLDEFGEPFVGPVSSALEVFDVSISLTSTSLLEATMAGRVAIQLYDEFFEADRFDEAGYAHCLPTARLRELPELCAKAEPVANPELELRSPEELAARLKKLLGELAAT